MVDEVVRDQPPVQLSELVNEAETQHVLVGIANLCRLRSGIEAVRSGRLEAIDRIELRQRKLERMDAGRGREGHGGSPLDVNTSTPRGDASEEGERRRSRDDVMRQHGQEDPACGRFVLDEGTELTA